MGNLSKRGRARPVVESDRPKLLVLDAAYTLEAVRQRGQEAQVLYRDLDGFFEHVWSVHPFASLLTSEEWSPRYGKPQTHELSPRHTFIEGKVGRFAWLRAVFPLNFLIAQADLFLRLRRLIRRERISAIRAPDPLYVGLFGLALARSTGIPLVVRVGANNDKIREITGKPLNPRLLRSVRVEKLIECFVLPRADLVAGANQDNLRFALANGARPGRTTLFRYGNLVDPRHFTPPAQREDPAELLAKLGLKSGQFLMYVGRLEPIKQPDHVLEVLARVRSQGLEVKALLAGDGQMRAELETRARKLGLQDSFVMAGNLDQRSLALLYPAAAVVLSPHTGRALAEAALGQAPVVAYDVDWQGEVIENGKTGILVPHGDLMAMSRAAQSLLGDRTEARRLGQAVRRHVLELLDPERLNAHEREEYSKLLHMPR